MTISSLSLGTLVPVPDSLASSASRVPLLIRAPSLSELAPCPDGALVPPTQAAPAHGRHACRSLHRTPLTSAMLAGAHARPDGIRANVGHECCSATPRPGAAMAASAALTPPQPGAPPAPRGPPNATSPRPRPILTLLWPRPAPALLRPQARAARTASTPSWPGAASAP